MTYRLLLAVYVSLALWSDTAQAITLKSHATATPACDSECDYCEAEEEPRTGNDGVEEFSVTRIRDDDWEGPSAGDRFITKGLICEFKKMQAKALADGYPRLKIVSGFRSLERQTHLSEESGCTGEGSSRSCATGPFIEEPGTSEHGIGIALDIMTRCGKCHIDCKKDSHPDSACETKELTFLKEHANAHNFFPSVEGSPGHFVYGETKEKEQKAEEQKDDGQNGWGKRTYVGGGKYEGQLKDGKRNGRGKYTWKNGSEYDGEWKDDKRDGQGRRTYVGGDKYDGQWKDDKRNGRGKLTFADGTEYDGEWKDDKLDGQGRHTYKNGGEYNGQWKDDKRDGQGKYTFKSGTVREGLWQDNEFVGEKP